jgi:hypothetical protein
MCRSWTTPKASIPAATTTRSLRNFRLDAITLRIIDLDLLDHITG